jgi:hypothetical protein
MRNRKAELDLQLLEQLRRYREAKCSVDDPPAGQVEAASIRHGDAAIAVLETPALTLEGALAKLQVAADWFRDDLDFACEGPITCYADAALVAIADDLAALALSIDHAREKRSRPNADSELLALVSKFRHHMCALAKFEERDATLNDNLGTAAVEEIERRREPYLDKRDAFYGPIGRTPARTVEGVIAKLTVAAEELAATPTVLDKYTSDRCPEYVLASAIADALTLSGRSKRRQAQTEVIREELGLS